MVKGREGVATALVSGGIGTALGVAIGTLLGARPALAAPEGEKLDYLIDIGQAQTQLLQKLVEIGEGLTMPELILPSDISLKFPEAMIVIPPDPEMLAMAAMIKAELGQMLIPTWRVALACPALATTVLPFNVPPGWVTYRRKPLEISSDLYDPLLALNVYSDDTLINPVAPMPITGAFTIDMGEYVTQWVQLRVEVINATVFNAVVSFQVCTYLMDNAYWENWVRPLIEAVRVKVEGIIE